MTETFLLGFVGIAMGMWLAWYLAESLASMISIPGMPPTLRLSKRIEILLFASGTGLFAALLAGLWPAWHTSHLGPAADLKRSGSGRHTSRIGLWLVPAQVMLGVLLLHTALLLSGTLLVSLHEHSGFAADNVVLADLDDGTVFCPARCLYLPRHVGGRHRSGPGNPGGMARWPSVMHIPPRFRQESVFY